MADIDSILDKAIVYGEPLQQSDKVTLRNALYGLAPSSAKYRQIMEALKASPHESSYKSPNMEEDGTYRQQTPGPATFQGPPTLDFFNLDNSHMFDERNSFSEARGSDAAGGSPALDSYLMQAQNSRLKKDTEATAIGMGGQHSSVQDPMAGVFNGTDSSMGEQYDVSNAIRSLPSGYSFDDVALGKRGALLDDPNVLANLLAQNQGAGTGYASFITPFLQGADLLSAQGVFGNGANDSMMGGPTSNSMRLAQIEDVAKMMSAPGYNELDPTTLYQSSFNRVGNTDFDQMSGQNGQPLSQDDIIELTNSALMGSAPFMTQESAAYLSSRLQKAAIQYKTLMATGEINVSYPKYLDSIKAGEWIGE